MEDKERTEAFTKNLQPHPREKTTYLAHLFFCWQLPIFFQGRQKDLTEEDLYQPLKECNSKQLGDRLETIWTQELTRKKPSLTRALIKMIGWQFSMYGICYFPVDFLTMLLQPYFLKKLLDFYTPNQTEVTHHQAYTYAAITITLFLIHVFFSHYISMQLSILAIKMRIACCSLIYRHVLKMKKGSLVSIGYLVNLVASDVSRMEQVLHFLHFLWISPLEFIFIWGYLDGSLGHTALSGNLVLVLCLFSQIFLMKQIGSNRRVAASKTDERIRLMNDLIGGIQTVKMYGWEEAFSRLIRDARRAEMLQIATGNNLQSLNVSFRSYLAKVCVVLSVVVAVAGGTPLTSQYLFTLVWIFDMLKVTLIGMFPIAVIQLTLLRVALQRIQDFLLHDHVKPSNVPKFLPTTDTLKGTHRLESEAPFPSIRFANATVKWDTASTNTLTDINLSVEPGELVGVIGAAGAGKSTLLQVILKELDLSQGSVSVTGSVSYACQEPWIFSSSVKQNILFGQDFVLDKYLNVIDVCALERDLAGFPHGDQTIVGERGVLLSGGQKARINLARAVYRDADIYLLDDPLSAVDAQVAKEIFDGCIRGYLKAKTVVLVTHQIQYLKEVDKVYVLDGGRVVDSGDYDKIVGLKLLSADQNEDKESIVKVMSEDLQDDVKEHRSSGTSDWQNFRAYFGAAGHWLNTVLTALLFIVAMFFGIGVDYFVAFWINVQHDNVFTTNTFLYIYSGLTIFLILTSHLSTFILLKYCVKISKNLHNGMLDKVLRATISFFNYQSSGRILNRFSKDLGSVDDIFPMYLGNAITVLFSVISVIIIVVALNFWMIFPTIIVVAVILKFSSFYQPTNKNLKRTESTTRSAVLAHLSASLQGLTTIKSSSAQEILSKEFDNHQDTHTSALYLWTTTLAAYGFWIDLVCVVYSAIVIFSCFFYKIEGRNVGNIGLIITQSTVLIEMVQFGLKVYTAINAQLTSVERIVEYTRLEPELDTEEFLPAESWPEAATISFQAVSLKYNPDEPPVLKNVTFTVKAGEKIGIVGRTGAGKTSLVSILFRLYDFEGSVFIDGVDTKVVSLNTLRSKISIIPQEPVLFLGALRKNIDPFDEFTDDRLWSALEELGLKKMIPSLDSMVSEKGSNFSVGQRQLLCLVRALLRNNKIIVLDEATASVDLKTDELIQTTIRKKFKDCTVLTIAHRLNTVADSDRVLVMDKGRVVEFDQPWVLLQNQEGFFYGYVKQNGEEVMERFLQKAEIS